MQNFKTYKSHIFFQGLLIILLVIFTVQERMVNMSMPRIPILLIIDSVAILFFLSSLLSKITITDASIIVRAFLRKSEVNFHNLQYVQCFSAFARWVVVLNDGVHTVVVTSLSTGLGEVKKIVEENIAESEKGKLQNITEKNIRSKMMIYNAILIMLCLIVSYGLIKNILAI